jgi:hypothetical protein
MSGLFIILLLLGLSILSCLTAYAVVTLARLAEIHWVELSRKLNFNPMLTLLKSGIFTIK